MATFLLICAIMATVTALLVIHRFNHKLAKYHAIGHKVYPAGQPAFYMNTAGKWLTYAAIMGTAPLVLALIFSPEGCPQWIINLGVASFFMLIIATVLVTTVLITNCASRKIKVSRVLSNLSQGILQRVKALNSLKVALWSVSLVLTLLFLPFFVELFNFLVYLIAFVLAARFGLLDYVGDQEEITKSDYVQEGVDYDFYFGTNEYNSFPDN